MTTVHQEAPESTTTPEDQCKHSACAFCFPPNLYNIPGKRVLSFCGVVYIIQQKEIVDWNNRLPFGCVLCETVFMEHFDTVHPEWC